MTEFVEIWERDDCCHPFREPDNNLVGIYSAAKAQEFLIGKKIVDPYGGACGYFTRKAHIVQ
jgi:hypothetical protein